MSSTCQRVSAFVVFVCLTLFCSLMFACECFVRVKSFRKKKKKVLKIALVISIYYTTDVYPPQPTYREPLFTPIYLYLWPSMSIFFYENLFKSYLSVRISSYCANLFKLFVFVKNLFIYAHLWKISSYFCSFVKNLFFFMLICENLFYCGYFRDISFEMHFLREQLL